MNKYGIAIRACVWIVVAASVAMLASTPAAAQRKQARVWGVISDSDGAPIEGARVTARDPETGSIKADEDTNASGEYSLLINDATVTYIYRVEKDGYVPWEGELEVAVKANAEYNFTLPSAEGQSRMGADGTYSMHPDAVEPFTRGSEAARAGDYETASAAFQEVLAIDDKVAPAYVALAAINLEKGDYEQAEELATRARELDPANGKAVELMYVAGKQLGASIEELTPLLAEMEELAPQKAVAGYTEVGMAHFQAGDMAAAVEILNKALELDPDSPATHLQLGLCYVNQEDNQSAREHFERVVELAPDSEHAATASEMLTYLQ